MGRTPDEAKLPTIPDDVAHVWSWFLEVFHGELLTFNEILAWSTLTGTKVLPWEARWLADMSVAWAKETDN